MNTAERSTYLSDIVNILRTPDPRNRTVNIVCHGHSVPAGYFATPVVDSMNAYPHLLHAGLKHRFPYAIVNVIVTAIGGENSEVGARRFARDVLCHRPDVVTIDYGLNDRSIGLERANASWLSMIEAALKANAKVLLLTPSPDKTQAPTYDGKDKHQLGDHADQIRRLAAEHGIGLADSLRVSLDYIATGELSDILSWSNHPNRAGHELIAKELMRWFPVG